MSRYSSREVALRYLELFLVCIPEFPKPSPERLISASEQLLALRTEVFDFVEQERDPQSRLKAAYVRWGAKDDACPSHKLVQLIEGDEEEAPIPRRKRQRSAVNG